MASSGPHRSVTAAGSGGGRALLDKFSTLRFGSESTPTGNALSLRGKGKPTKDKWKWNWTELMGANYNCKKKPEVERLGIRGIII